MGRKRILVVEDERTIRRLIQFKLQKLGYEILQASDGKQALEILKEEPIDLMLLDIMMPRYDGLSVLRDMHEMSLTSRISVIMVTAVKDSGDEKRARELGCAHYLHKPFKPKELADLVNRVLGGGE